MHLNCSIKAPDHCQHEASEKIKLNLHSVTLYKIRIYMHCYNLKGAIARTVVCPLRVQAAQRLTLASSTFFIEIQEELVFSYLRKNGNSIPVILDQLDMTLLTGQLNFNKIDKTEIFKLIRK